MKAQIALGILPLILLTSLTASAGGGTLNPRPNLPESCHAQTTIDGAHNQDCAPVVGGGAQTNPVVVMPKYGEVQAHLILEGSFISEKSGQEISIAIVGRPVQASWFGYLYDVEYKAVSAKSNLGAVKVSVLTVHDDSESVHAQIEIAGVRYAVYFASHAHEVYHSFRQSSSMYSLDAQGSFFETFHANENPDVPFIRVRTGKLIRIPLH